MVEKVAETWVTAPKRPVSSVIRTACLVHIYPTGPQMGSRYTLGDSPLVIGRGEDTDISIQDNNVSRKHARVEPGPDGFYLRDLGSTNGTFVNDLLTSGTRLHDGDYLRIGNCIYRFLAGGNVEAEYHEEIYRLTIIDGLTQIHNRRYFMEFLDRELVRSARHHRPLSLVMFDLDFFRAINEDHGHLGGDYALRELANCVRKNVRREDLFARYGGEEFGLVLVETGQAEAAEAAERIRLSVAGHPFSFEGKPFQVTVSMGVASTVGDHALTTAELIRRADALLYHAKHSGRNRVCATLP